MHQLGDWKKKIQVNAAGHQVYSILPAERGPSVNEKRISFFDQNKSDSTGKLWPVIERKPHCLDLFFSEKKSRTSNENSFIERKKKKNLRGRRSCRIDA